MLTAPAASGGEALQIAPMPNEGSFLGLRRAPHRPADLVPQRQQMAFSQQVDQRAASVWLSRFHSCNSPSGMTGRSGIDHAGRSRKNVTPAPFSSPRRRHVGLTGEAQKEHGPNCKAGIRRTSGSDKVVAVEARIVVGVFFGWWVLLAASIGPILRRLQHSLLQPWRVHASAAGGIRLEPCAGRLRRDDHPLEYGGALAHSGLSYRSLRHEAG